MLSDWGFAITYHAVNCSHLGWYPLHCFPHPCLCPLTLVSVMHIIQCLPFYISILPTFLLLTSYITPSWHCCHPIMTSRIDDLMDCQWVGRISMSVVVHRIQDCAWHTVVLKAGWQRECKWEMAEHHAVEHQWMWKIHLYLRLGSQHSPFTPASWL